MLLPETNLDDEEELQMNLEQHIHDRANAKKNYLNEYFLKPLFLKPFNRGLNAEVCLRKIDEKTQEIMKLQEEEYRVTDVIVTFETEDGQRRALTELSSGRKIVKDQMVYDHDGKLFRGEIILDVIEPREPSSI